MKTCEVCDVFLNSFNNIFEQVNLVSTCPRCKELYKKEYDKEATKVILNDYKDYKLIFNKKGLRLHNEDYEVFVQDKKLVRKCKKTKQIDAFYGASWWRDHISHIWDSGF